MGRPSTLKIDLIADAKKVGTGVGQADSKLSKFGKGAAKVGKVAALGLAAAGAAAVVVGKKLHSMGEQAVTSDARIANIAKQMGLFGKQSDQVAQRLSKLAETTARATGIDQNQIKATQAKLLTFKELAKSADEVGGNFDRANAAALDLAAAGFGSAEGNAVQLGKALNDPIKGLSALARSGVTFTETEKARITTLVESNRMGEAQAKILAAIEKQVGGTAEATADGSARMAVGFSQLQEKLGRKLVPAFDRLATFTNDKLFPAAEKLANQLAKDLGPAFAAVGKWIGDKLIPAAVDTYQWFVEKIAPGIRKYLTPIIDGARDAFAKVGAALERNQPQLEKLHKAFRGIAEFIANKVMPVVGRLIGEGLEVLGATLSTTIDSIGWVIDKFDSWIDKIESLIGWLGKIKVPNISLPDRPGWLGGGRAALAPAAAAPATTAAAPAVTIHVSGFVGDESLLAREIEAVLARQAARVGGFTAPATAVI